MDPEQTTQGETLTQTADRARSFLAERGVTVPEPTVSAQQLAEPVQPVSVPEIPPAPGISPTLNAGVRSTLQSVRQTAQGARELQQRQEELADLGGVSAFDISQQMQERFGVTPERLSQLQQFESELASLAEESALAQTRIAGAGGQTLGQGQREVTQEQRELAVRSAATAAQAEILRGNIEQGRQLAKDAVAASLADREFRSNLLLNQINALQGQVSEEQAAALEDQARAYEQELQTIEQVKELSADAIASGVATQAEISQLTSTKLSDEEKIALSQQIIGRGATELRDIEIQKQTQSLQNLRSKGVATGNAQADILVESGVLGTESDPMLAKLAATKGGRLLTQSEVEPLTNSMRVIEGLNDLENAIGSTNTDPIIGFFRSMNPYDLKASEIDAAITQLVPQLARGTYGEVGVLTDSDMARYSATLPNLTSTEAQNKAIMALTLRKVRSGFVSQLSAMESAGRDVSGFVDDYQSLNAEIDRLEREIGVGTNANADLDAEFDSLDSSNTEKEKGGFWKSVGGFLFGE